jgi:hypothetical protein
LATLLVFCPCIAKRLDWVPAKGSVHVYLDKSGDEMVRTLCWRDGLDQSIEDDGAVLEGQSVVLTDLGRAQFEAAFDKPKHRGTIWRTIAQERGSKPPEVRVATVTQIPWMIWKSEKT